MGRTRPSYRPEFRGSCVERGPVLAKRIEEALSSLPLAVRLVKTLVRPSVRLRAAG